MQQLLKSLSHTHAATPAVSLSHRQIHGSSAPLEAFVAGERYSPVLDTGREAAAAAAGGARAARAVKRRASAVPALTAARTLEERVAARRRAAKIGSAAIGGC
jgi:hypothetical protein